MKNLLKRPSHSKNRFKKERTDLFWIKVIIWSIYTAIIIAITIFVNSQPC